MSGQTFEENLRQEIEYVLDQSNLCCSCFRPTLVDNLVKLVEERIGDESPIAQFFQNVCDLFVGDVSPLWDLFSGIPVPDDHIIRSEN